MINPFSRCRGFSHAGMDLRVFVQVSADPPESVVLAAVIQALEQ